MKKLEIERKWLLKRVTTPPDGWITQQYIHQFYIEDLDKTRFRLRYSRNLDTHKHIWYKTIKRELEPGIYEEDEKVIPTEVALEIIKTFTILREIRKIRSVAIVEHEDHKFKYEIDSYVDISLSILEIEFENVETFKKSLTLDQFISADVIQEVTGNKNFSNFSLSDESVWESTKDTMNFSSLPHFIKSNEEMHIISNLTK